MDGGGSSGVLNMMKGNSSEVRGGSKPAASSVDIFRSTVQRPRGLSLWEDDAVGKWLGGVQGAPPALGLFHGGLDKEQAAQRYCGCPIPGCIQGQFGQCLEQLL